MSVERSSLASLSQATSERTPWDIPLHLLMTSRQGEAAPLGKFSRTFCVPALDGDRSPFGERHLLVPRSLPEQASEVTPRHARRPSAYSPAERGMCKLPLLVAKELDARESAHSAGYHNANSEQVTPRKRGCQSAPPTRQQPLFFVPTPPATSSPTKTPRHRRVRRVSDFAATSAELSTRLPTTPKECAVKDRNGILGGRSPKTRKSQSAVCAGDALELMPISPQEPASSKNPRRTHARRGSAFPVTGDAQSIAATSAPKEPWMKNAIPCAKSSKNDNCQCASSPQDTPTGNSFALDTPVGTDAPPLHTSSTSPGPAPTEPSSIVRWKIGEKIGAGAHGCVFKAQNLVNGHLFVAKESVVDDKEYRDKLWRELEICRDLNHPNIVKCLGHEYCERHLYIHLEYVSGGSLRCILSEFGPLEEELMLVAMRGLLDGLAYLHTRSPPVVHRDIKSPNVLVAQDFCMKLADFGCSKRADMTTSFTTIGSVLWMAPEVIRGQTGGHGRKADIWSLGCVFIEMATAEKPWASKTFDNVWQAMRHIESSKETPPIPAKLSETCQDLIAHCVQRDPSHRACVADLLAYDLVQSVTSSAYTLSVAPEQAAVI